MTEAEYVQRVRELARERGLTLDLGDIRDSLDYALQAVGRQIAESGEYALRQKEYSVTMTSGVASLSTHTDMIIDKIDTVLHPNIDGGNTKQYFSRIPDGTRKDLAMARNTMFPPYVVENLAIYCSMGNGIWPDASDLPPDATLLVLASQMPDLTTLPVQYQDDLIAHGVSFSAAGAAAGAGA